MSELVETIYVLFAETSAGKTIRRWSLEPFEGVVKFEAAAAIQQGQHIGDESE